MTSINFSHMGEVNYYQAMLIIDNMVSLGVRHAVISPGSRSTPLTLACERHPKLKTWFHIDERSAAFFALGLATRSQFPAIVIATSGSAICHWLAAITEAKHSYTPLLFLSADRPNELQKVGANQTIDQVNLFQHQVLDFFQLSEQVTSANQLRQRITQAVSISQWPKPGPVHINIPIREPLLPQAEQPEILEEKLKNIEQLVWQQQKIIKPQYPTSTINQHMLRDCITAIDGKNGLIVCGRESYSKTFLEQLEHLSKKLNCPVLVDPLSQIRLNHNSPQILYNYDAFLNSATIDNIQPVQWVIRFGQIPVSKTLMQYLQKLQNCKHILVSSYADFLDPLFLTDSIFYLPAEQFISQLLAHPIQGGSLQFFQQFEKLDQQTRQFIEDYYYPATHTPPCMEAVVIKELCEQLKSGGSLFSANSMCIRDLDTFIYKNVSAKESSQRIDIFANRGCSGIDGNVSSFFGILAAADAQLPHFALFGDLTALHDSNGFLWAARLQTQGSCAVIIILNNHGGGIFNYLPQKQLHCFEKAWITDPEIDFAKLADLYQLHYQQVTQTDSFAKVLSTAVQYPGISMVEVLIDQKQSVMQHTMLKKHINNL